MIASVASGQRVHAQSWHDGGVIAFARIVLRLLADVVGLAAFSIRLRRSIEVEKLKICSCAVNWRFTGKGGDSAAAHRCGNSGEPGLAIAVV